MFSFANPYLLYLLFLIPAITGLYLLSRYSRKRKLKRYGKLAVLSPLMPDASRYKPWIKITLQLLAVAALVFVLARPRAGAKEEVSEVQGIEVMICLDVSNSMLASSTDDPKGVSRLQRAKLVLEKLIDKLDNDKVGLIVFAGDAYTQLPITSDFVSAKMFLNSISTEMVPTQGTSIGAAIEMAMSSFTPTDDMQKAIIVITDGESFDDDPIAATQTAVKQGIQVDVIGLGSTKGSLIPIGRNGQFMKDDEGNPVTTRLDEAMAQKIAETGEGIYVQGASSTVVKDIDEQLDTLAKSDLEKVIYSASAEQFPVFGWLALALVILDIFMLDRKVGWLKKINFFSK
ncbi:MAG TPA: VWA domain-containing protein [Muribaculum sp.]|jgi:Ca-activated chloride channel family protein|uniref:VWA domain-containing protein n=1 Tax=Heminiphilus faecis TaxID=2601703 RepID=A0ABV4CT79_9BACT|nr:VWA domain-containing protein [Heminiphilus faecis]RLT76682.1 VWA domain-containing protein [bacterium J10(2018)]HRF67615.1 VWA domain-containing protein [Muribaculum sp.]